MASQAVKKFSWVIKNFSSLRSEYVSSGKFMVAGCKWGLMAYPKGFHDANFMSLYLFVANHKDLPSGWKRHTRFSFSIVNRIPEEICQKEKQHCFHETSIVSGFQSMVPLDKLHAKDSRFLLNGELKIVLEIDVLEVIIKTGAVEGTMNVNGFQVLSSQVEFVKSLFEMQPDIALNFRMNSPLLKTAYMNVLLSLTEAVQKPFEEISKDDLADAYFALESMTCVGFKFDWLEKKLKKYPLASRIKVKNLSFSTSEDFLRKEFSAFGEIAEVELIKYNSTKTSKRHASIQFTSQDDALLALETMDRQMYNGRMIYVEIAKLRKRDFQELPIRASGSPEKPQNVQQVAAKEEVDDLAETSAVNGSMNVHGFQVLPSQVEFVKRLFKVHPHIAPNFRIKRTSLKTAYMNVLLSLIDTVQKPFKEISKDDLDDAYAVLKSFTFVGFKLVWLKNKLNKVSKKKKEEEELKDF